MKKFHSEDLFLVYFLAATVFLTYIRGFINTIYIEILSLFRVILSFIPGFSNSITNHMRGFDMDGYGVVVVLSMMLAFYFLVKSRRLVF